MSAHFEIHVADMEAAKKFYELVLGWQFEPMPGGEEMDYHLVVASDIGPGKSLSGGLMKRIGDAPAKGSPIRGCTLTFDVADCDATYATALSNGGAEALPPADYPGIGRCAYMEDGQGNVFGVIAPEKGA